MRYKNMHKSKIGLFENSDKAPIEYEVINSNRRKAVV